MILCGGIRTKANTFWIVWIIIWVFLYLKLGKLVAFVTDASVLV